MVNGRGNFTVIPGREPRRASPESRDNRREIPGSQLTLRPGMTNPLYDVVTVWMPHSVFGRPRQRPARASSSGEVRLVQGMHPTERKPDATSGCGGSFACAEIGSISSRGKL